MPKHESAEAREPKGSNRFVGALDALCEAVTSHNAAYEAMKEYGILDVAESATDAENGGACGNARVFDAPVTVFSFDGSRLESFSRGEGVKNVHRFGARVIFEPVNPNRVASTYAMDLSEFERKTTMVRQAHV